MEWSVKLGHLETLGSENRKFTWLLVIIVLSLDVKPDSDWSALRWPNVWTRVGGTSRRPVAFPLSAGRRRSFAEERTPSRPEPNSMSPTRFAIFFTYFHSPQCRSFSLVTAVSVFRLVLFITIELVLTLPWVLCSIHFHFCWTGPCKKISRRSMDYHFM